jgi:hypothetical protein
MSEGDAWLHKSVYDVSLLLRETSASAGAADGNRPVHAAEQMVRRFCTKELRGVPGGVGDVEEYIANAALDLVIMGVWSLVAAQVDEKGLPVCLLLPLWSLTDGERWADRRNVMMVTPASGLQALQIHHLQIQY